MPTKTVLLVNEDPSLPESLQKGMESKILSTRDAVRLRQKFKRHNFPFVIFEAKKDWTRDLKKFYSNGNGGQDPYIIIAPSGLLKLTTPSIKDITKQVLDKQRKKKAPSAATRSNHHRMEMNLALEDFVERKVHHFVKQMKTYGGRNIYSLLLREIEEPLIRIVLRETNGNQTQAAHLLGMNRNTLRKKITSFRIPMPKARTNGHSPRKPSAQKQA
ncbi:MAG TPA: helix-turn-helix domain-containing protein [Nitrospiria bacterium]